MPAMARMLPWITKLAAFLPPGVDAFLFPVCSFVVVLMYGYSFPVISNFIKIPGGNDADPGLALVQHDLVVLQVIVMGDAELPVLLPADRDGLSAGDENSRTPPHGH